MSSFAALFERRGRPLSGDDLDRLSRAVAASGAGHLSALPSGQAGAGFALFSGCDGGSWSSLPVFPVGHAGLGPEQLEEMAAELGRDVEPVGSLLERAGQEWRRGLWARLSGRFNALLYEPGDGTHADGTRADGTLSLACDGLGANGMFYFMEGELVVVSSRLDVLLHWPQRSWRLAPDQFARFFAFESPAPGRTYFEGIHGVGGGSVVEFSEAGVKKDCFWDPTSIAPETGRSDDDWAEEFAERLRWAIGGFLVRPRTVGVMLSGGLDSTSLAILAARSIGDRNTRIAGCSWIFDQLVGCDERSWIRHTLAAADLETVQVSGDQLWPLCDPEQFARLPGWPEENPYRGLKRALYRAAADRGRTLLLNGSPADVLQRGGNLYLRDLLRDRRGLSAAAWWGRQLVSSGWRMAAGAAARVVLPSGRRGRASKPIPSWLTAEARALRLEDPFNTPVPAPGRRDVVSYIARQSHGLSVEARYAGRDGVEVSSPYWTRDFVEFMLSLPAHQVFRPGVTKFIARRAMRGVVPEPIRLRQEPTHLDSLFDRGLFEREGPQVAQLLDRGDSGWRRFVDAEFVAGLDADSQPLHKMVLWQCVSFELWRRRFGWEFA